jgi:hypothetical protein
MGLSLPRIVPVFCNSVLLEGGWQLVTAFRGVTCGYLVCLSEVQFSLFRAFAEPPFLGFRGVVARAGCEYYVTVAAEMDFYPKYLPWAFVTPSNAGAHEDGKLLIDMPWDWGSILLCGCGWGGRSIYRGGASDFCWGSGRPVRIRAILKNAENWARCQQSLALLGSQTHMDLGDMSV